MALLTDSTGCTIRHGDVVRKVLGEIAHELGIGRSNARGDSARQLVRAIARVVSEIVLAEGGGKACRAKCFVELNAQRMQIDERDGLFASYGSHRFRISPVTGDDPTVGVEIAPLWRGHEDRCRATSPDFRNIRA